MDIAGIRLIRSDHRDVVRILRTRFEIEDEYIAHLKAINYTDSLTVIVTMTNVHDRLDRQQIDNIEEAYGQKSTYDERNNTIIVSMQL